MSSNAFHPRFVLFRCLIPFVFASLSLGASAQIFPVKTIRLCTEDADNYPWLIQGGVGIDNVHIDMVSEKSGLSISTVVLSWKKCLESVRQGTLDGGFSASYLKERAEFAEYPMTSAGELDKSRRIKFDSYSLYRLKDSKIEWDGKSFTHLEDGFIGAKLGYSVVANLRDMGLNVHEFATTPEVMFRNILRKRISLIAILTSDGDALLEQAEFNGKIEKIKFPLYEKPYFVIFNKKYYAENSAKVEEFWTNLRLVRESPQYKKLFTDPRFKRKS